MQEAARRYWDKLPVIPWDVLGEKLQETDTIYIVRSGPLDFGFDNTMKIAQDEDGHIAKFYSKTNGIKMKIPISSVKSILDELRKNLEDPQKKNVVVRAHLVRSDGTEYEIVSKKSKFGFYHARSY